ncbi:MAG: hypothetical protein HQK89_06870 [Nitrospirae bacterium]|nr:hypothetical protein [Nitrospirota bacterium]
MNAKSLIRKALILATAYPLKRYAVNDNMFFLGDRKLLKGVKRILLYFPNNEYMHLGDHFFFEPLMSFLKYKGFEVKVITIKSMEFYVAGNGHVLGNFDDIARADLVITRTEFFYYAWPLKKNTLFISTFSPSIKKRLCQDIVDKVAAFLSVDSSGFYVRPSPLANCPETISLDSDSDYLVYNNYVDSAFYRLRPEHYRKLDRFAGKLAKENGLKVIHTGSKKDRERDRKSYGFVDVDLRGIASPADMFYLASLHNVKYNVSFDTYIMHIFFIYGKKSFVLFRGRFTRKAHDLIVNYVLPPFEPEGRVEDLIEYL